MERDKIIFFRNLFLRMFVVGIVMAPPSVRRDAGFLACRRRLGDASFQRGRENARKHHPDFLHQCADRRSFLFLVPAIALHWTAKRY